jgi:hypothetical protein
MLGECHLQDTRVVVTRDSQRNNSAGYCHRPLFQCSAYRCGWHIVDPGWNAMDLDTADTKDKKDEVDHCASTTTNLDVFVDEAGVLRNGRNDKALKPTSRTRYVLRFLQPTNNPSATFSSPANIGCPF